MNKEYNIIGLAGRAISGKTEIAKFLKQEKNASILTIASFLKKLCCRLLGDISIEQLNTMKNEQIQIVKYDSNLWSEIISYETNIPKKDVKDILDVQKIDTVRDMLQIIGTNIIRKYNPSWHIEQLKNDIITNYTDKDLIVIDDVRFVNERQCIEKLGGKVIFIIRPQIEYVSNHLSETSLHWYEFDKTRILLNISDVDSLKNELLEMYDNNFDKLTDRRKEYEAKFCNQNDDMFGVKYKSIEDVLNIIDNIKCCDYDNIEHAYYLMVNNKNFNRIYNPYIIENLKFYL